MCPPMALMAVGSLVSAGAAVYGQNRANKARKEAAARAKAEGERAQRNEDAETRGARQQSQGANRDRRQAAASYTPTPFSPRSMFMAA